MYEGVLVKHSHALQVVQVIAWRAVEEKEEPTPTERRGPSFIHKVSRVGSGKKYN